MLRLSESRCVVFLAVFWLGVAASQDPFGDLPTNSQLWKSFQEEMKTLEQAAHRVNTLLSERVAQHVNGVASDQEAKPSESVPDATVLANPGDIKDGILTKTEESKPVETTEKAVGTPQNGGVKQTLKPQFSLGSFMNSFGFFNNLPEPWWKGKNVCVEKSEKVEEKNKDEKNKDGDHHILIMGTGTFEHCKQTAGKYICTTVISTPQQTKTLSTTYQCCEGFRRQAEGCVEVELKDPIELLESLDSKEFAAMLKELDIMKAVADKNVTIFAPLDDALKNLPKDSQETNQIRQRRRRAVEEWSEASHTSTSVNSKDMAMAHMTEGLLDVDDFTNEMVLKSLFKETPLRVNIYPGREDAVITVNCARLRSWDNYATHARVHTLDRALEPVTQTVTDVLSQPQFSQFKQFLEQEGLWERLQNSSAVTVFAPNNEAWDKLGGLKDKYSRGEACIDKVLRHHVLPLTLCAAPSAEGRLTTADVDGELVRLSRNADNQLMVDERGRVVQEDIVATNGVVHALDKVLMPKSAKPLSDLLTTSNHTTFLSLLDRAGLLEELDRQENITVFVPTERALRDKATATMLDGLDTEALRRVLLYHVSDSATCDLAQQSELKTREGGALRVTMYNPYAMFSGVSPRAAVQCAPLGRTDGKACHAVAHEVTRLLMPPNATVLQVISDDPQLSMLRSVIEGTELEKDLDEKTRSELLSEGFTFLAPSDDAFNKLNEDSLNKLLTDKKFASEVLRMHLLGEPVCCASITSVPWPFTNSVRTIEGRKVEVNRDRKNRVVFGTGTAEKCDVIATDGLVHVIDSVLLPEAAKVKLGNVVFGSPDHKIMLFGI